ncbi:MAG TPA: ABC transporter ATP-binding protein [Thermoanaerobaculia bacterium]|nr:ABC transporter ATP-binding protein [Thermoanaerobaculia bacterium]
MAGFAIRLVGVQHAYGATDDVGEVTALEQIDLSIPSGSFAVLMGPSGSGKSTLLNLIGAVDRPSSGSVFLDDTDIARASERELTLLRRSDIGFVFQFFNLIPTLSVEENIGFPLALAGSSRERITSRTREVLRQIGLEPREKHYPNQLSGGEMQRVAIGRAVVHRPRLILADEPTGNLDSRTGEQILDLLRAVHEAHESTIVMATHSERAASYGDLIIDVIDGTAAPRIAGT